MEKCAEHVSLAGEVSRVSSEPVKARNGAYTFTGIELAGNLSGHRSFIIFPDYCGHDFFEFPKLCWFGAKISARNLDVNNFLEDGSRIYSVNPDSEIVLEPFRPVSVLEAVESFNCLRSIDLRYRTRNGEPFWMAKGKAIHLLFDHLACNPHHTGKDAFDRTFSSVLGEFIQILPGSSARVNYHDLKHELRRHHQNMASWMSGAFGRSYDADTELDKLSVRYGLKGRADAVIYSDSLVTLVEIKSGKFTSDDHLLQLYAYNMMIGDDLEKEIDSYVVYSSTGLSTRLDGSSRPHKRSILQGRNRSIALKRHYAFGDNLCAPMFADACSGDSKCFSRPKCEAFYGSGVMLETVLTPRERLYYDTWFRLICVEEWEQESEFAQVLDKSTLTQRLLDGVTIPVEKIHIDRSLDFGPEGHVASPGPKCNQTRSTNPARQTNKMMFSGRTSIKVESANGLGDLGLGDDVIIHRGDVCSKDAIRARVTSVSDGALSLFTKIDCSRLSSWMTQPNGLSETCYIDRIPFLRAREMSRKTILNFLTDARGDIVDKVLNNFVEFHSRVSGPDSEIKPENEQVCRVSEFKTAHPLSVMECSNYLAHDEWPVGLGSLNEKQKTAVIKSLAAPVHHLVHGPPGTGKTQVLSRLITEFIKIGKRVLVTCPTNIALDRVLIALMKMGFHKFIRVGNEQTCSQEFLTMVKSAGLSSPQLGHIASQTHDFDKFRKMVDEIELIGATAYQCAFNPIFLKQRFDVVVIDEAGQLDEPAALAPLSLADKFILCGDHLQLPPVVRSSGISPEKTPNGLELSLFERLFLTSDPENISSLCVQYRMNSEVQDIPSRLFYEGRLVASPEVARRRLTVSGEFQGPYYLREIIDPETPVIFVDVQGGVDAGKTRPEEAEIACDIVRALVQSRVTPGEIGVITPYRAQQSMIRQKLTNVKGRSEISVDTVDSFQGGEREVIIISLARSDSVTSFLADPKRLNVSLSRARSKLILLGRSSVLEENPLFNSILDGIKKVVVEKQVT